MPEKDDQGNPSTLPPRKYVSEFAPSQMKAENKQPYTPSFATSSDKSVPEAQKTTDPSGEVSRGEYASFGRRSVASFLDGLILGIINAVVYIPVYILTVTEGELAASTSVAQSVVSVITLIIGLFYSLYFIGKKGQTPGKMALGIKVVKKDTGLPPGYVGAFLREYVGKFLSSIFLLLGYLWMIWDKEKQTWHDKIANTIVIKA